jgi:hypothetical protein
MARRSVGRVAEPLRPLEVTARRHGAQRRRNRGAAQVMHLTAALWVSSPKRARAFACSPQHESKCWKAWLMQGGPCGKHAPSCRLHQHAAAAAPAPPGALTSGPRLQRRQTGDLASRQWRYKISCKCECVRMPPGGSARQSSRRLLSKARGGQRSPNTRWRACHGSTLEMPSPK